MDEMRNNVGNLRQISDRLDAALMELEVRVLECHHLSCLTLSVDLQWDEASPRAPLCCVSQDINKEESLLEKDQSQFPMLQTLLADKQPHEQLWTTALNFQVLSDEWMNGERGNKRGYYSFFPPSCPPCIFHCLPHLIPSMHPSFLLSFLSSSLDSLPTLLFSFSSTCFFAFIFLTFLPSFLATFSPFYLTSVHPSLPSFSSCLPFLTFHPSFLATFPPFHLPPSFLISIFLPFHTSSPPSFLPGLLPSSLPLTFDPQVPLPSWTLRRLATSWT